MIDRLAQRQPQTRSMPQNSPYRHSPGKSHPFGATVTDSGVNFSVFSRGAEGWTY
jgi:hypothetical protein